MNHFAHAWIALHVDPAPRYLLGAMLPDLLGFLRIPTPRIEVPETRSGIALHHATDRVFHALPGFRSACRAGVQQLCARGLRRGPARGAAHVGIELLLDAALAARAPETLTPYRAALQASRSLRWDDAETAERLARLARRLAQSEPGAAPIAPTALAARIQRTLQSRPRLALQREEQRGVERWLEETAPLRSRVGERLALQTLDGLRASGDAPRRAVARSRTPASQRRATGDEGH